MLIIRNWYSGYPASAVHVPAQDFVGIPLTIPDTYLPLYCQDRVNGTEDFRDMPGFQRMPAAGSVYCGEIMAYGMGICKAVVLKFRL